MMPNNMRKLYKIFNICTQNAKNMFIFLIEQSILRQGMYILGCYTKATSRESDTNIQCDYPVVGILFRNAQSIYL